MYGRRVGKSLTEKKKYFLKEKLAIFGINLNSILHYLTTLKEKNKNNIVLEIGFGSGENLRYQLEKTKKTIFIGSEIFLNGIVNFLTLLENYHKKRIKIFNEDVRLLLEILPNKIFSKIFILFPDPWPKERHKKRRLLNSKNFTQVSNSLRLNGKIYLATDVKDYFYEMKKTLELSNFNILNQADHTKKPYIIAETKYMLKAYKKNKKIYYIVAKKTSG